MEKKRKPLWLKLLIGLFSSIFSLAMLLGVFCLIAYVKYDVNVFAVYSQVKEIAKEPNVDEKFTLMFSNEDKQSVRNTINAGFAPAELITYSEDDGYGVNTTIPTLMVNDFSLTEKECGALLDILLAESKTETGIQVGEQTLTFNLVQIAFDNVTENSVDFNAVVKIDITSIKDQMSAFPLNWVAKLLPNNLYISSVVTITKSETPFGYTIESKSLTMNNLDEKGTAEFLKTINKFVSFGTSEELSLNIGGAFANGLLGTEETNGFAYSLKSVASDFKFETVSDVEYLTIIKKVS